MKGFYNMSNHAIHKRLLELEKRFESTAEYCVKDLYQAMKELTAEGVLSHATMDAISAAYPTTKNNLAGYDSLLALCTIPELRRLAYGYEKE